MMMTNNSGRAGIYIHIPFCIRKCIYCDFVSYSACSAEQIRMYFDALERECGLMTEKYAEEPYRVLPADSLFIGGGTPSVVDSAFFQSLFALLPLTDDAEVTMEGNPGTLSREKLNAYRRMGVNRLSLGVQSFNDPELVFLGRIHSRDDAIAGFKEARKAGFENINLDLIFGFPGQTMESWKETLRTAVSLEPEHLSFYSLQIEEGTPLYDLFRDDKVVQVPDELNREMYHYAVRFLSENGYERYEISNAARQGRVCRHNMKYWTMEPYIGLGAASHSYIDGVRYSAPDTLEGYLSLVKDLENDGDYISGRGDYVYVNTFEESLSDYMFTGLRLTRGVSIREIEFRFGICFSEYYKKALDHHLNDGTMIIQDGFLRFTDKGIDLSNHILLDFI